MRIRKRKRSNAGRGVVDEVEAGERGRVRKDRQEMRNERNGRSEGGGKKGGKARDTDVTHERKGTGREINLYTG